MFVKVFEEGEKSWIKRVRKKAHRTCENTDHNDATPLAPSELEPPL